MFLLASGSLPAAFSNPNQAEPGRFQCPVLLLVPDLGFLLDSSRYLDTRREAKPQSCSCAVLISSGVVAAVPGPAAAEEQPSGGFSSTLTHGAAGGTTSGWRKLGTRVGWSCGWGVTPHCCPPTCSSHLAGCAGQAGLTTSPYFLTPK